MSSFMDTNREFPFLSRVAFNQLLSEFLSSCSLNQQRKAISTQEDYDLIISILRSPQDTSIETAKDRFWTKKSFYIHNFEISQNPIIQLMEVKNSNKKSDHVICLFQNLYNVLGKIHSNTQQHSGSKKTYEAISNQYAYVSRLFVKLYVSHCTQCCMRRSFLASIIGKTIVSKKLLQHIQEALEVVAFLFSVFTVFGPPYILQNDNESQGSVESSNKTLKNASSIWMEDNNRRDWSIGLPIEWKQHNVNMKEDLPEGIIKNEENFEGADNNNIDDEDNQSKEENRVSDPEDEEYNQAWQFTRDDSNREQINDKNTEMFSEPISQQDIQGVQRQKTNESNNSYNFIPSKKCHYQALQDISNNPKYQHNIYYQIANKNLMNYCSKMKNQMHARYNIYEHIYKVGDLVKIQIAKIDREPGDHCALPCKNVFPAGEVLPLGLKEFPELDNPLTDTTISIIEAARLQSISLASNKGCNCRGDCLTTRCLCRKVNTLCESGYHPKNSKCKHRT
ncbi:16902_t:CDS:2 [Cetraspora pellucida]|uniref:16902_t:CDS:1 n=1 Tax=Cetraspora pellucida TaxID=1433469 RepID=A0A9N9NTR6_9GLOM|nr:16902_t:CDS:2 [Cetraspora pellucida]